MIYIMSATSENNKRIAKNTLFLYVRMLLIMGVTLYTSRVVLQVLGVEDFGIYNVVGGIVALFSMFTGSLTSAINRFLTVELGNGNQQRLAIIFSTSVNIQLLLSVIICVFVELAGVWFLNNRINIPAERLYAANWVLHTSILTFMTNLISVPYNAAIIAHERMKAFAYVSVLDVFLKLGVVYFLFLDLYDGLVVYSVLLFIEAMVIRFIYGAYCKRHFEECSYRFVYDKVLLKEMAGMAGWNFIGVTSGVLRDQGVNILLNLFFNPVVNAARAISVQVGIAVNSFANNFFTALNPQIMKSYVIGDKSYMIRLVFLGTRFAYYLLLLLSLPILLEAETILSLWLQSVPEYTTCFVRLTLIFVLSESISQPLVTPMFATGKIRNYQIIVGGIHMLIFPLSYLALYCGAFPEIPLYITIVISQLCLFSRLLLLRKMIGLPMMEYLRKVYNNILSVSIVASLLPSAVCYFFPVSFLRLFLVSGISLVSTIFAVYRIGCSGEERVLIRQKIACLKYKIIRK